MLKPRVLIELTNRIGNSEACFCHVDMINVYLTTQLNVFKESLLRVKRECSNQISRAHDPLGVLY